MPKAKSTCINEAALRSGSSVYHSQHHGNKRISADDEDLERTLVNNSRFSDSFSKNNNNDDTLVGFDDTPHNRSKKSQRNFASTPVNRVRLSDHEKNECMEFLSTSSPFNSSIKKSFIESLINRAIIDNIGGDDMTESSLKENSRRNISSSLVSRVRLSDGEKDECVELLATSSHLDSSVKKTLIESLVNSAIIDKIGDDRIESILKDNSLDENGKVNEIESIIDSDSSEVIKLKSVIESVVDSNMPSDSKREAVSLILNRISSGRLKTIRSTIGFVNSTYFDPDPRLTNNGFVESVADRNMSQENRRDTTKITLNSIPSEKFKNSRGPFGFAHSTFLDPDPRLTNNGFVNSIASSNMPQQSKRDTSLNLNRISSEKVNNTRDTRVAPSTIYDPDPRLTNNGILGSVDDNNMPPENKRYATSLTSNRISSEKFKNSRGPFGFAHSTFIDPDPRLTNNGIVGSVADSNIPQESKRDTSLTLNRISSEKLNNTRGTRFAHSTIYDPDPRLTNNGILGSVDDNNMPPENKRYTTSLTSNRISSEKFKNSKGPFAFAHSTLLDPDPKLSNNGIVGSVADSNIPHESKRDTNLTSNRISSTKLKNSREPTGFLHSSLLDPDSRLTTNGLVNFSPLSSIYQVGRESSVKGFSTYSGKPISIKVVASLQCIPTFTDENILSQEQRNAIQNSDVQPPLRKIALSICDKSNLYFYQTNSSANHENNESRNTNSHGYFCEFKNENRANTVTKPEIPFERRTTTGRANQSKNFHQEKMHTSQHSGSYRQEEKTCFQSFLGYFGFGGNSETRKRKKSGIFKSFLSNMNRGKRRNEHD